VTLTIGVIVSMFSALVVTRVLLEILTSSSRLQSRPALMGMTVGRRFQEWVRRTRPDLLGSWRRWLGVSTLLVALAVTGLVASGVNLGLEFVGGRLVEFSTSRSVDTEDLRSTLTNGGLPRALIQKSGEGNLVIRTETLDADTERVLFAAVEDAGGEVDVLRDQFIGPTLGEELRNRALVALGIALLLQLTYLAIRFRWTIALAAVASMVHDVAILIGAFAWMGKTFDGIFLAALLTVIGYSINDSVVIFDRIREQQALHADEPPEQIANDACLQTVPRTINTGLGALLILVSLYVLGGDTLADFALALVIGIVVGTYSSVFTAAPIAIALEKRYPRPPPEPAQKAKPARARSG
ncbi:MAG: protein translocase subunit SecF, partial [Acidimicrobiia bacterium]